MDRAMGDNLKRPNAPAYFAANLVLLVVVGVAALTWILDFTDWFPAVGGVFALGGALSWLAFVSRLLKEERLKELQDWADHAIFDNRRTRLAVVVTGIAGLVGACFVGTLELQSESGASVPRTVSVRRAPQPVPSKTTLSGTLRLPYLTSWAVPSRLYVKVSGYPEVEATVRPWSRTTLTVPDQFLRPVVVLKPDKDVLQMLVNNPRDLVVRVVSGPPPAEHTVPGYHGETIWVGCDEDVDVPAQALEAWKSELAIREQGQLLHLWSHPRALTGGPAVLNAGDRLSVEVLAGPGRPYARADVTVRAVRVPRDFPQEEEIHVLPQTVSASSPP
jgi:hypothetical protein